MRRGVAGFTLAELLIALALLGVIAAFTIPKVLQTSGVQEATAKTVEAIATLEQAFYILRLQNAVDPEKDLYGNLNPILNSIAGSPEAADAANGPYGGSEFQGQNGTPHPCTSSALSGKKGWIVLPSGVVISGLAENELLTEPPQNNGTQPNVNVCFDYNGAKPPNRVGSDVFVGTFNQWGDFDVGQGTAFTPRDGQKAFYWGNNQEIVFGRNGARLDTAPWNTTLGSAGNVLVR